MSSSDDVVMSDLDQALDGVEGWFSPEQVARVVERASVVPATGRIVEIGSFRGRSMIAIARSAPEGAEIVAIDPHAGNDRGPQEIEGFEDEAAVDSKVFLTNLERAGVRDRVTYVRKFSHDAARRRAGAHRPAAHRRRPPLQAGQRRHRHLGRQGGRRRVGADPRLVLVGRRDAGPGVQARLLGEVAVRRAAAARWPSTSASR